jgi:ATP phosphoribosyltransferase
MVVSPFVVAIPKGRLAKQIAPRLLRAGVAPETFADADRRLQRDAVMHGVALRFLMLKPDDVPTYVEHGAAHAGVVGRDILLERGGDVYVPLDLGLGRCRMVVAGPEGSVGADHHILRVATRYPRIATAHYAARGEDVEVIYVQGSVETAPLVGLSDVIVDLVETGETLRQNGLVVRETVCEVSAVLVVNRAGMKLRRAEVKALMACLGAP